MTDKLDLESIQELESRYRSLAEDDGKTWIDRSQAEETADAFKAWAEERAEKQKEVDAAFDADAQQNMRANKLPRTQSTVL